VLPGLVADPSLQVSSCGVTQTTEDSPFLPGSNTSNAPGLIPREGEPKCLYLLGYLQRVLTCTYLSTYLLYLLEYLQREVTVLTPGVATCRLKAALAIVKQWKKDWADTPRGERSPTGIGLAGLAVPHLSPPQEAAPNASGGLFWSQNHP
jgi:hypothetical protein